MARAALARPRNRLADRAERRDVIVLDQDAVEEPESVIAPAPAAYRVLLERAPAGGGLARVDDLGARAAHRQAEAPRVRRDARESLHEVQRRALRFEDADRGSAHVRERRARGSRVAVACRELTSHAAQREDFARDV